VFAQSPLPHGPFHVLGLYFRCRMYS
jgi:hypothetical protein